jgi:purine-binding chemotaxis protein CheW
MRGERQLCTFFLGDIFCGVEAERVQEVIRYQEMTPLPLVKDEIRGLINLRGKIVTVIDLRRLLDVKDIRSDERSVNVVMGEGDDHVSFMVDSIHEVMRVNENDFERPPETVPERLREIIRGAYKLQGRLLLLIDASRVIDLEREGLA